MLRLKSLVTGMITDAFFCLLCFTSDTSLGISSLCPWISEIGDPKVGVSRGHPIICHKNLELHALGIREDKSMSFTREGH